MNNTMNSNFIFNIHNQVIKYHALKKIQTLIQIISIEILPRASGLGTFRAFFP